MGRVCRIFSGEAEKWRWSRGGGSGGSRRRPMVGEDDGEAPPTIGGDGEASGASGPPGETRELRLLLGALASQCGGVGRGSSGLG